MGGEQFSLKREAWSAEEAFRDAREQAFHDHGHSGYTGTIAEKGDFRVRTPPVLAMEALEAIEGRGCGTRGPEAESEQRAREAPWRTWFDTVMDANEKWGPAECVVLREPETPRRLTKAQADKLAKEKFGPTAEVLRPTYSMTIGGPKQKIAIVRAESDRRLHGMNEKLPNGKWRGTVASASGKDAAEAYGKLFAKKGVYLFFGWASS